MIWNVPNMWEGGECFIIGGGSSIPRQFGIPEKVIKSVLSKEASPKEYSPYLSALHNKHVIGVNASFYIGDWIDICFFGDMGFFLGRTKDLLEFPGLKVSCNSVVDPYKWVKYLKQSREKRYGLAKKRTEVIWGQNSGAASINLAVHLGAKKIILLGFDMRVDNNAKAHWHTLYNPKDPRSYANSFARHLKAFPNIASDAKNMGIEIINANPDSNLKDFKKVKLENIL